MSAIPLVGLIHRSSHHAAASGYARLAEFIPEMDAVDGRRTRIPYRVRKVVGMHVPGRSRSYDSNSVAKEADLLARITRRSGGVAHYFDAERDAYAVPLLARRRGWAITGSFHYPPDTLRRVVARRSVRSLDAAIALASNQTDALTELVGPDRVHVVPIGVDTEFFSPPRNSSRDLDHVVLVGQHLRDFPTFAETVQVLRRARPTLRITAVTLPEYQQWLPPASEVERLSGLDDQRLRGLYRSAGCLLLPLIDAAACTAIVEALACGLPVVTSDVGGTRDYVPDSCGARCTRGDVAAHAGAVEDLLDASSSRRSAVERAARDQALQYSLPVVAGQLAGVMRSVVR